MSNPNALDATEAKFLRKAQKYFRVPEVQVVRTRRPVGDIAVDLATTPPTIIIGHRWERSNPRLKKSKLVHELLHVVGVDHDSRARRLGYFSNPNRDVLSPIVYDDIESGGRQFRPERFGL